MMEYNFIRSYEKSNFDGIAGVSETETYESYAGRIGPGTLEGQALSISLKPSP